MKAEKRQLEYLNGTAPCGSVNRRFVIAARRRVLRFLYLAVGGFSDALQ